MPPLLKRLTLALALLVPLSGCAKQIVVTADALCKSWKHQTVSKRDVLTQDTAAGIEGNNKARPEWGCEYGQDQAKG
jgi:hypothetical protein